MICVKRSHIFEKTYGLKHLENVWVLRKLFFFFALSLFTAQNVSFNVNRVSKASSFLCLRLPIPRSDRGIVV